MTHAEARHIERLDHCARTLIRHARRGTNAGCDCPTGRDCDRAINDLESELDTLATTEPTAR